MDKFAFVIAFLAWYVFGFLGLGVNFAIRFLRSIRGGNGLYTLQSWQKEFSVKIGKWPAWQIIIFAAMGGYTIMYSIIMWLGTHWAPTISLPFWRTVICEGILKPSPFSAVLAPLSLAGFEWLVGRAQKEIEKKLGERLPPPVDQPPDPPTDPAVG